MRFLPTYWHGIMDYIVGAALLFAPNIFGFADYDGAAVLIPRILGVLILGMALMTDFEVAPLRKIPMRMHLMMDYIAGAFLAASPWLFGFAENPSNVWLPHLIVGIAILGMALVTQHSPATTEHTRLAH